MPLVPGSPTWTGSPSVDSPPGGGDDGGMEARVSAVEQAIVRIDVTMTAMREQMATKADLAEKTGEVKAEIQRGIVETQRWTIATVIGLFVGFGGLFLAMSNALKPAPPSVSAPPQVVIVPYPPAAPASRP